MFSRGSGPDDEKEKVNRIVGVSGKSTSLFGQTIECLVELCEIIRKRLQDADIHSEAHECEKRRAFREPGRENIHCNSQPSHLFLRHAAGSV